MKNFQSGQKQTELNSIEAKIWQTPWLWPICVCVCVHWRRETQRKQLVLRSSWQWADCDVCSSIVCDGPSRTHLQLTHTHIHTSPAPSPAHWYWCERMLPFRMIATPLWKWNKCDGTPRKWLGLGRPQCKQTIYALWWGIEKTFSRLCLSDSVQETAENVHCPLSIHYSIGVSTVLMLPLAKIVFVCACDLFLCIYE